MESTEAINRVCNICKISYCDLRSLESHLRIVHTTFEKNFTCEHCEKPFSTSDARDNHLESCHTEKSLKCDFCDKTFSTNQLLVSHTKQVHNPIEQKCDMCEKVFNSIGPLQTHIRNSHERAEDKNKCDVCEISFKDVATFNLHLAVHDEVKKFKCNICWKTL